ncbi:MAG: fluoride efflux transporter CrcB [Nocardioidaceae bacterium]
MTVLLVLLGGAVGAPVRYLTDVIVRARHDSVFPWGTFAVNVVGSFILGATVSSVVNAGAPTWVQALIGAGFCGALTTFSTFGFETVRLVEDGHWWKACTNVSASIVAGYAACALGWTLVGWLA